MDLAIAEISDVFDASVRSDEGVVAFGIRSVHALFIGSLDAVVELHEHHAVVFDVDVRGESGHIQGRPAFLREGDLPVGLFPRCETFFRAVVDREASHSGYASRVSAGQPVDDIDVMCAFLEEETVAGFPLRAEVAEVAAAVVDEMAHPDALDVSDDAGVDDFLHFPYGWRVAHVVSEKEL